MVTEPCGQRSATGPPVLLRRCQLGEEGPKRWLPVGDVTMPVVLAVDFGSSNTAAAYRDRRGAVHEIRLTTAGSLMPSGVLYRNGRILVGRTALQAAFSAPEAFEPTPKRRLADREILLGGALVKVTDLVAAVFAEVLVRARHVMGSEPDEVVVTHPDQWAAPLQQLLAGGAVAAGVDRRRLRMVSEAQAAAWFYAASAPNLGAGARLVVFDFGAGTCDVAVLERQPDGRFAVLASDGLDGLGGQDVDARIHAWVRKQLATRDPVLLAEVDDPRAIATRLTLNDRIRDAKEALSEASSAAIVVAGAAGSRVLQLTRGELDGLIGSDIARAVDLTKRVMASANARRPSPAAPTIYLTGGSSHIPLVHARLAELGPLGVLGDPKTVVVQGALRIPPPQPIPPHLPTPPQPRVRIPPPQPMPPRLLRPPQPQAPVTAGPAPEPAPPSPQKLAESTAIKPHNWRRRAGLAAFCVVVALVIAVVAVGQFRRLNQSHPTPPPTPTSTVAASKLDGILLSPDEIRTIVGATELQKDIDTSEFGVGYTFSDQRCAGSVYAADPSVYKASGWTGVKNQVLTEPADEDRTWNHWIEQTAVSFKSADLALALRNTASADWKACEGRQVKQTSESDTGEAQTYTWIVGNVIPHDQTIALTNVQKDYVGSWSCQRAMNAISNVILDVMACSDEPGDEAVEIAQQMAAKLAGLG
jgi:PknH-like extracellular domain/Hsp70 protein